MRTGVIVVALALTLATGCGLDDPYAEAPRTERESTTPTLPEPPPGGEMQGTVPEAAKVEPRSFPAAGTTPEATLRRAASLYGNWTSTTAPRVFDELVDLSVGDARAQMREIAAQSETDVQQVAAGARSEATVEVAVVRGDGDRRRGLVVTHEQVHAPDIDEPAAYRVTVAYLERRGDRWVLADWRPQP